MDWPGSRTRHVAAQYVAAAAALLYSSFLMSYLLPTDRAADFVSELERPGVPYAEWYRASDLLAGVLLMVLAWLSWPAGDRGHNSQRAVRWSLVAVAAVGLSSVLDGSTSMDCRPSTQAGCDIGDNSVTGLMGQLLVGHTISGLVGFAAAGLGAAWAARAAWLQHTAGGARRTSAVTVGMRVNIVLAAAIGLCGLADLALLLVEVDVALVERIRIVVVSAWIAALPWTVKVCVPPGPGKSLRQECEDVDHDLRRETADHGGRGHDRFTEQ